MSAGLSAFERQALPELGALHECEGECEAEGEAFLGSLGGLVMRGLRSPTFRRAALAAARAALGSGGADSEPEGESELNPIRRVYPDAMLEHMAHQAMQAETEAEAGEAFLPLIPLVASKLLPLAAKALPLAARALPRIASTVGRLVPRLTRGVTSVARTLYRDPRTRGLLRAVPSIARRTVGVIARQAAQGVPVTPQAAAQTLARHTAMMLANPGAAAGAVRRSRALDLRLHRAMPVAGPAPGRRGCGCGCACACPCCGR
jgi:hypothetical protein